MNGAKSVTDEQIQHIIDVRNELAALNLRDSMARTAGSDTFQLLNSAGKSDPGPVGTALRAAGGMAAHVALGMSPAAGLGNAALSSFQQVVKPTMRSAAARRAETAAAARRAALLSTRPTTQNPLQPP